MIQTIGVMIAAYIFTRMMTAGIKSYPNDDKATIAVIRVLSMLTALFAFACAGWILFGDLLQPSVEAIAGAIK